MAVNRLPAGVPGSGANLSKSVRFASVDGGDDGGNKGVASSTGAPFSVATVASVDSLSDAVPEVQSMGIADAPSDLRLE